MKNLSVSLKKPLLRFCQLGTSSRHPQGAETTAQATRHRLRYGFPSLRAQSETACLHFTLTILLRTVVRQHSAAG